MHFSYKKLQNNGFRRFIYNFFAFFSLKFVLSPFVVRYKGWHVHQVCN